MTETAQSLPAQCKPGELWYPGLYLDEEYTAPSTEELLTLWSNYTSSTDFRPITGVYGVYDAPEGEVKAVASVDLCEVVRDTVVCLDSATGIRLGRRGNYEAGTWFNKKDNGPAYEFSVISSVLRVMMSRGLVQPVEEISDIRDTLRSWRHNGIYVVANTSTLPGCEQGTIEHTLSRDLPDCFDALVLPRNYDGSGSVTKAGALSILAEEAGIDLPGLPVVHIDDMAHHILGFQESYRDHPRIKLLAPIHLDNHSAIAEELHCATPLDAFEKADTYFKEQGVL